MKLLQQDEWPNHNIKLGVLLYMYMKECPAIFQNINLISIAAHLWERFNC